MSKVEKKQLFDGSSSEDDDDSKIKINRDYAQRYDEWREAEIKRKLEDRYGNLDEELSSSSSDGDEDPQELEKAVSKDFFEVISQLRKKDPKIYNPQVRFFKTEEGPSTSQEKKKKEKPIYLRDYERKLIVERGGVLSDDESDTESQRRPISPSLAEKERSLKESLQKVVHSDSDDDDGLLIKKVKTAEEKKKDDDVYLEWLSGRKEELKDKSLEESLSHLKEEWSNPNLDEGEKFLRDYVLNKRYLDAGDVESDPGNLTEEDVQDEYMDEFERKYNFRFEEPDSEFLKRYPRTIESSVRKKDDRRKRHRDEVKKRKEEEKLRQREELKVLKSLKKKEILKKIEKIKEITGNSELGISDKDLEDDYDPEQYDRRMNELFNDEYYQEGDEELNLEELPLPPIDEELLDDYENWDEYQGEKEEEGGMTDDIHCEDPNFNMDCDYDPVAALLKKGQTQSSRERRKLKRQSRFGTLVRKKKPEFNPDEKSFQEYVDEYYGIDYEDIIGGQPCRFKYRKVMPNSFGLTIEEILAADDKELNAWVSIKKAIALKPDHVEMNEKRMYELKARNEALKRRILPSLYKHETEENYDDGEHKSQLENKGKKSFGGKNASHESEQNLNDISAAPVGPKERKGVVGKDLPGEENAGLPKKKNKLGLKTSLKMRRAGTAQNEKTNSAQTKSQNVTKNEKTKKKRKLNDSTVNNVESKSENIDEPRNQGKKRNAGAVTKSANDISANDISANDISANDISANDISAPVKTVRLGSLKKQKAAQKEKTEPVQTKSQNVTKNETERKSDDSTVNNVGTKSKNNDEPRNQGKKRPAGAMTKSANDISAPVKKVCLGTMKKQKAAQAKSQNFTTNEMKKTKRKSNDSTVSNVGTKSENNDERRNRGKKIPAGAMSRSTNDISVPDNKNLGSMKKQKGNEDSTNRILHNPISSERRKRQRRGKDRKKLLLLLKNPNETPRDVKAENKARAIRRQNYKSASVLGEMSDDRLKAYGLNPKKFKNKLVYG